MSALKRKFDSHDANTSTTLEPVLSPKDLSYTENNRTYFQSIFQIFCKGTVNVFWKDEFRRSEKLIKVIAGHLEAEKGMIYPPIDKALYANRTTSYFFSTPIRNIGDVLCATYPEWKNEEYLSWLEKLHVPDTLKLSDVSDAHRIKTLLAIVFASQNPIIIIDDVDSNLSPEELKLLADEVEQKRLAGALVLINSSNFKFWIGESRNFYRLTPQEITRINVESHPLSTTPVEIDVSNHGKVLKF